MINANAAIVLPMIQEILPEGLVPWLLAEVTKGINVSQLCHFTESPARLSLKERILLPVFRAKTINVLWDNVKIFPDDCCDTLPFQSEKSVDVSIDPSGARRIAIRQTNIHEAYILDPTPLQIAGMATKSEASLVRALTWYAEFAESGDYFRAGEPSLLRAIGRLERGLKPVRMFCNVLDTLTERLKRPFAAFIIYGRASL